VTKKSLQEVLKGVTRKSLPEVLKGVIKKSLPEVLKGVTKKSLPEVLRDDRSHLKEVLSEVTVVVLLKAFFRDFSVISPLGFLVLATQPRDGSGLPGVSCSREQTYRRSVLVQVRSATHGFSGTLGSQDA
jgi:hypothetical protein